MTQDDYIGLGLATMMVCAFVGMVIEATRLIYKTWFKK